MKTLHIGHFDKFTAPLWGFLKLRRDMSNHVFLYRRKIEVEDVDEANTETGPLFVWAAKFIYHAYKSDKIILNGLLDRFVIIMLFFQPWILKKCYWVIWGGDLYYYKDRQRGPRQYIFEKMRSRVIRRIGHLVTYIDGDVSLARKWYGATGAYHVCLGYLSNVFRQSQTEGQVPAPVKILAGNSATDTNNHRKIFDILKPYRHEDILIFCPLSYGPDQYADNIAKLGAEIFGRKFIPLLDFMTADQYRKILEDIDIGVFAHDRQQGMGNLINLLGYGKKVYINESVTQWETFDSLGLKVFSLEYFNISNIDPVDAQANTAIIRENYSETLLLNQWNDILSD